MAPLVIKAALGAERRRLALERTTLTFDRLRTALAVIFHTPVALRYLDGDGDDIGIESVVELDAALLACGALLRLTLDAEDAWGGVKCDDEVVEICEDAPLESSHALESCGAMESCGALESSHALDSSRAHQVGGSAQSGGRVHVRGLKRLSGAVERCGRARGDCGGVGLDEEMVAAASRVHCGRKVGRDESAPLKRRRLESAEEEGNWRRGNWGAEQSASAGGSVQRVRADRKAMAGQCAGGFGGGGLSLLEDIKRGPSVVGRNFCASLVPPTLLPFSDGRLGTFPPGDEACDGGGNEKKGSEDRLSQVDCGKVGIDSTHKRSGDVDIAQFIKSFF